LKRIYILLFFFFAAGLSLLAAQDFIFYGNLSGRIFPKNFLKNKEINSCFLNLSEFIKAQNHENSILVNLGNSLYGSAQSVYYLMNRPDEFLSKISDFKMDINCIGQRDLYADQAFLKKLTENNFTLYSANINSNELSIKKYFSTIDNGIKIVFVPLSIVSDKLIFEDFEILDPFESLKDVLDFLNIEKNGTAYVIAGISVSKDYIVDIPKILEKMDNRVNLVVIESEISGTIDIEDKKVLLLSEKDILRVQINGNSIKYYFENLPVLSDNENFKGEIEEIEKWLNHEICEFIYKPRDYGFNGLNPVNTVAEFLANIMGTHPKTVPLIVFKEAKDSQKVTRKDVLEILNGGTLFTTELLGGDLKELFNNLIKEKILFEVSNINYIANVSKEDPIEWFEYRGFEIPKKSEFELIINDFDIVDLKFKVATEDLRKILSIKKTSMKYVKNWYLIDKPFEESFRYYVVDWGDSVGGLSLVFQKDAKLLMDINGLKDPRELMAGDVLVVPMF